MSFYDQYAETLVSRYESRPFEEVHSSVLPLISTRPGLVLDVGAGSGRDAAWFARRGHEVFAVEPATRLRDIASEHHDHPLIHWVDDELPDLRRFRHTTTRFDLIWLSAVWMHIAPSDRRRTFRKLSNRLQPGGRLMITLRHGRFDDDREAHPVDAAEVLQLARDHGLVCKAHRTRETDRLGRGEVSWESMVLELPDDGTGAFPVLRNAILNDARSSTYKFALLRCLLRAASGSGGLAKLNDNGDAEVPLGLVALNWLRSYLPLLHRGFHQAPPREGKQRLGFQKEAFRSLEVSPQSLKPGARIAGEQGELLRVALSDAARTIQRMPARYITWPGTDTPVFDARYGRRPAARHSILDEDYLAAYGRITVPGPLWSAMSQHAAWIEPALEAEWIRQMRDYDRRAGSEQQAGWEDYQAALQWVDPEHDTRVARRIADAFRSNGIALNCVWTGARLRREYAVDHLMPWARWPCNDLWNLAPVAVRANSNKRDRLPSPEMMLSAESRLCEWWWRLLQDHSEASARQFQEEVSATLPFVERPDRPDDVFAGATLMRASLRRDQQIPEWSG